MKKLLELFRNKKQFTAILVSAVLLVAVIVFTVLAVILAEKPTPEAVDEVDLNLANTEGMDFDFDEDDLSAGDADGEGVIDLGGNNNTQATEPTVLPPDEPLPPEETDGSDEQITDPTEGTAPTGTENDPSDLPVEDPTEEPTEAPTICDSVPVLAPDEEPTEWPTQKPTEAPTVKPTERPTQKPTEKPTEAPTVSPSERPDEPPKDEWDSTPVNITHGGEFVLSAKKKDVCIVIDAPEEEVTLHLAGATVSNSKGPAVFVRSAKKVTITLKAGTVNTISDGASYRLTDSGSTVDAAIFSKCDLTVNGSGTINVMGNFKHGIVSKDDLVIASGTVNVTSKNVALSGKDSVKINSGSITLNAGSDGIRADNLTDPTKGYVSLAGGVINITSGNDGIQAETVVKIEDVDLTVKSGGGSGKTVSSASSHKGIKAGSDIYVTGGTFDLDCADDAIHSNGTVTISGGNYTLATGDDAIHADSDLEIAGNSTKLTVTKSKEALEATKILVSGGNISLVATDDGINAGGGNDGSGDNVVVGKVVINGGTLTMKVGGDGIDTNGTMSVTGGTLTVSVPDKSGVSVFDYDETGEIKGGKFIGFGDSAKAKNFSSTSTQGAIMVNTGAQAAGSTVTVKDSGGKVILTAKAEQGYSCVLLSAPEMEKGGKYTVIAGSYTKEITMESLIYG